MGMFDYIRCEIPLPDGHSALLFQTKDTQEWCEMKVFTIRADGRLIKSEYEYEETPQAEKPYPNADSGSIKDLCGCIRPRESSRVEVDQAFDGDLEFYPDGSNPCDVWYRATFREGCCLEICWCPELGVDSWVRVWPDKI